MRGPTGLHVRLRLGHRLRLFQLRLAPTATMTTTIMSVLDDTVIVFVVLLVVVLVVVGVVGVVVVVVGRDYAGSQFHLLH